MLQVFREKLKLSCIAAVPQAHRRPQIILNLLSQPVKVTPSVSNTTDMKIAPESIQFGKLLPRILQAIWETDLVEGPVPVSKFDVMDAYHRCTLWLSQLGAFTYVVPLAPDDFGIIICINMVLPMRLVDSPRFLFSFL